MVGAKNGQQCHYDASSSRMQEAASVCTRQCKTVEDVSQMVSLELLYKTMNPRVVTYVRAQKPTTRNGGMTSNHNQLCHRQVATLNKPDPSRISSSHNCSSKANYQSTDWPSILILTRDHYASTASSGDTSVSTLLVRTSYWLTRKPLSQQNRLYPNFT